MNMLKPKTIEHMQYFVGRICTIFTPPINRSFDELQSREHFVVKVQEVTTDGIWGIHPYRGTASFFPMSYVVFIQEEQVLDPNDPEHKQLIDEYEQRTGKKVKSDIPSAHTSVASQEAEPELTEVPFVDIDNLASLARQTKLNYAMHDVTKERLYKD